MKVQSVITFGLSEPIGLIAIGRSGSVLRVARSRRRAHWFRGAVWIAEVSGAQGLPEVGERLTPTLRSWPGN
jgi:hypothetical protein